MIGNKKGCGAQGFVLGLVFGPFGLMFMLLADGNRRSCPACKSMIHPEATICPHCRSSVEPAKVADRREWRGPFQDHADQSGARSEKPIKAAPLPKYLKWSLFVLGAAAVLIPLIFLRN
jgi:hypothetical protein